MRTLFIGGTRRGYLALKGLLQVGADVVGILSLKQDDHEVERYEEAIRTEAENHDIPWYETKWIRDRDYARIVRDEMNPDIAFVVGCRVLLPAELYLIPRQGTLAVHDSLLPQYRGFAPLNWSIINGESTTGVTLFYLNELMDGGDIVAQKAVPIGPTDSGPELYDLVCQATVNLITETYPLLIKGTAPRARQSYSEGSFACSRAPSDGLIDWVKPAAELARLVKALTYPYPGAFTFYEGRKLLVWKAAHLDSPPNYVGRIPGRVIAVWHDEGHVDVLAGEGILRLSEVQLAGESRSKASNVVSSVRATLGLSICDLLERIRLLEGLVGK